MTGRPGCSVYRRISSGPPGIPRTAHGFTIHNLGYHGGSAPDCWATGAESRWMSPDKLDYYGDIIVPEGGHRLIGLGDPVSPAYAAKSRRRKAVSVLTASCVRY